MIRKKSLRHFFFSRIFTSLCYMPVLFYQWEEEAGVETSGTKSRRLSTCMDAPGDPESLQSLRGSFLWSHGSSSLMFMGESELGLPGMSVVG